MNKKSNTYTNIIGILVFAVTIVMVFIVNRSVPFMMDDEWYMTRLSDDTPIRNLKDIFEAQVWHYNNWGGRSMAHALLQMILLSGEKVADVLNTLVTCLTAVIVLKFADLAGKIKYSVGEYLLRISLVIGLITGLNANWKMSMYWQAGATNYLHITVFILLFVYCYIRELSILFNTDGVPQKDLPGITFWMIPLAVIVGWSNENMGPTSFLIAAFLIGASLKKHVKVKLWMIFGAVFSLIGSAVCILAPGNFVRNDQVTSNSYGLLWQAYLHFYGMFKGYLEFLFPTLLLTAAVFLFPVYGMKIRPGIKEIVLLSAGIISCGAMLLSPHFPDRATYGSMMLFIASDVIMMRRAVKENGKATLAVYIMGGLIWLSGMFALAEFMGIVWGWIK